MQPNSSEAPRPSATVTTIVVVLALLLWLAVVGELLVVIPLFQKIFADFQLRLPDAAAGAVAVSRWCVLYFYVLPIPLLLVGALVAGSTWLIRHRLRRRVLGAFWCAAMLLLPAGLGFLVWLSCYLSYLKLLEALAGRGG